ncbi:MAG: GTPase domain-containing protein [Planctomycetaceae bacterium]
MSTPFRQCAETIQRLSRAVEKLGTLVGVLRVEPLEGREWYDVLRQKLSPQLTDDAFLVVAVVGGTNIGKSVVFNHIAGTRASSISPLASGTKHPVCLVPAGFCDDHDLAAIFEGFRLDEWTRSDEAMQDDDEHRLFWKTSDETPDNLLVLDTPDIDSDALVNWYRADIIRRTADVLIAVLTQQKYNDAAVKQFFRKAAAEDKAVIVVFNQCELPEDEAYWPLWLATFADETKIVPEIVYVVPNDRRAAEANQLPFYERQWRNGSESTTASADDLEQNAARDLSADLSRLRFADIKLRSLRGSLNRLLDDDTGVRAYLREIEQRSSEFLATAKRLSLDSVVPVNNWPTIPNKLLVAEIRQWWRDTQTGWAHNVHAFYDTLGKGMLWPFRFAGRKLRGEQQPPLERYRELEWPTCLKVIEDVFQNLTWMSESGSGLMRPHLERILAGTSRRELLHELKRRHDAIELEEELHDVVLERMRAFQTNSPELYRFMRQLNNVSAAVRPVTSVVLFTMGWGPAGDVVAQYVAHAAAHAVVPIVADFAGGTAAAVAGESALSSVAGQSAGFLQAKFQELQTTFTARRAAWLADQCKELLLGTLPAEMQSAADIPRSDAFRDVAAIVDALEEQLAHSTKESLV